MNLILFDDTQYVELLPLTFYRPSAELKTGILTNTHRWELLLNTNASHITRPYLQEKFPVQLSPEPILVNGRLLPTPNVLAKIQSLLPGQGCRKNGVLLFAKPNSINNDSMEQMQEILQQSTELDQEVEMINHSWDLFALTGKWLLHDMELLTKGKKSQNLSSTNTVIGDGIVFLDEGAKAECAIFNTTAGPVYLGKDAEVMEGAIIRGPFALGEHSVVKMMAKIYGPTTIGPHCKVGGEINNSVFLGYANKAHDGFLGQAVIGEWCNLGADTNNSNLKNTYEHVKLWSYAKQSFVQTGLQFCGLIMGDHSKCGINTMFNTGSVVGVNCNIFGAGYQKNLIPSFAWGGGAKPYTDFNLAKSLKVAEAVYQRRDIPFDKTEQDLMNAVYSICKNNRNY